MTNKKIEKTEEAPHRYKFPEAVAEIMDQLYLTKKELASHLVKRAMEKYAGKDDSVALITLNELSETGLILKGEESGNDAIYSITKKGEDILEAEAKKHVSIIQEFIRWGKHNEMMKGAMDRDFSEEGKIVKMGSMVSEASLRVSRILKHVNHGKDIENDDELQAVRYLLKEINHDIPIVETVVQRSLDREIKQALHEFDEEGQQLNDPKRLNALLSTLEKIGAYIW